MAKRSITTQPLKAVCYWSLTMTFVMLLPKIIGT